VWGGKQGCNEAIIEVGRLGLWERRGTPVVYWQGGNMRSCGLVNGIAKRGRPLANSALTPPPAQCERQSRSDSGPPARARRRRGGQRRRRQLRCRGEGGAAGAAGGTVPGNCAGSHPADPRRAGGRPYNLGLQWKVLSPIVGGAGLVRGCRADNICGFSVESGEVEHPSKWKGLPCAGSHRMWLDGRWSGLICH
jgi:hypothetical protein